MTTEEFRLHAHIVLRSYVSIGTTKKILNHLIDFIALTMNIELSRYALRKSLISDEQDPFYTA